MAVTFNTLVAQITAYLDRLDPATTQQIPNFLYLAELRIAKESKNIGNVVYVNGNFLPFNPPNLNNAIQKPGRYRRSLSFSYGTADNSVPPQLVIRNQMYLRSYEYMRQYSPNPFLAGPPKYYSDYGSTNFLIAPSPDQSYPFELAFLELPVPLSVNNQTNWYTNFAPELILYGALLEAIAFLKTDEKIPIWTEYYNRALASLNALDDARLLDRASNRSAD